MKRLMIHSLVAIFMTGGVFAGAALAQEAHRPVKLVEIAHGPQSIKRTFFGQVVARQTVDLAAQVGGQIVELPILEGQLVKEGDLIARLDLEPFELLQNQARVQYDQVKRTLERLKKLSGSTVSQVRVDDAQTQLELAELAVRNAEYALEHATINAPFDALVAMRTVANYTTVGAGTPIIRLHDMSELRIEIDVPEILFQRAGQSPDVQLTARFPVSDTVYPLEIREYTAQTSTLGQTFRLTLALPRPEGLAIIPGSSVTVEARLRNETGHPVLPNSAIHVGNDGRSSVMVFIATDDAIGTVEQRPVTISAERDGTFRVLEGLKPGELVVLTGVEELADGQAVRRFTDFES